MHNYPHPNYMPPGQINPSMKVNMPPYAGGAGVTTPSNLPPPGYNIDPNQQPMMIDAMQQHVMSNDEAPANLKKLDEINTSILKLSQTLITFYDELMKDKLLVSRTKTTLNDCIDCLKGIENDLISEINYLGLASTGTPHEGSIYGAKKDFDLAKQRLLLVTHQISSLKQALDSPLPPVMD